MSLQTLKRSTFTSFQRTQPAPQPIQFYADDPFRARFGHKLPRGLREEARGMQWRDFVDTYSPTPTLRIQFPHIEQLRGPYFEYHAEIKQGRTVHTRSITASGPASACTNLLADMGYRVEMLSFHQFEIFEATVTFIYAGLDNRKHWAMGFGGNKEQSIAAALSSAVELLHHK